MACFRHLCDNVPSWITTVNQLSAHVHAKQTEFAAEAAAEQSIVSTSSIHREKSIRSKTSSLRSQRSMRPSSGRGLKRLLSRESLEHGASSTKQRKTISHDDTSVPVQDSDVAAIPSRASATQVNASIKRARPKQVITFDGHTQKVLEQMVRDIWTAKSSLRSSRIALTMRGGFGSQMRPCTRVAKLTAGIKPAIPDLTLDVNASIEVDPTVADDVDHNHEQDLVTEQMELRMLFTKQRIHRNYNDTTGSATHPRRGQQSHPPSSSSCAKECPYDFIECQLENAQNLCETAAFRVLREGTCLEELDRLQQAYELILEASTTLAEQEQAESASAIEGESKTHLQSHTLLAGSSGRIPATSTTSANGQDKTVAATTVAVLEVDDNLADTAEISIDIRAFRRTRYGYGRHGIHGMQISRA